MLVLTRKSGETITIDGDIVVQIVQIRGRQVRLGISAPKSKAVRRGELSPESSALLEPALLSKKAGQVKLFSRS